MTSPHPFQRDPRKIGNFCVCGKGRTHNLHAGQGEVESASTETEAERDAGEYAQAIQEDRDKETQGIEVHTTPDNYFRVESAGTGLVVEIQIPEGDRATVLLALLEFMEAIKGKDAEPVKKKR